VNLKNNNLKRTLEEKNYNNVDCASDRQLILFVSFVSIRRFKKEENSFKSKCGTALLRNLIWSLVAPSKDKSTEGRRRDSIILRN